MKTSDLALWMKRRIWQSLRSWVSSAVADYKIKACLAKGKPPLEGPPVNEQKPPLASSAIKLDMFLVRDDVIIRRSVDASDAHARLIFHL